MYAFVLVFYKVFMWENSNLDREGVVVPSGELV